MKEGFLAGCATIGAVVLVLGLAIGGLAGAYVFNWYWAPFKGAQQVRQSNQSGNNRVVQQAGFETAYNDILKYDQQVKDAGAAVTDWDKANAGKPDNAIGSLATQRNYLAQTAAGIRQQCQNTVAAYNADAEKTLAKDWRREDLPRFVEPSSHCK